MQTILWEDFEKVKIYAGTVVQVEPFPKARQLAFKVWVDFGELLGVLRTSAQITTHYTPETLVGKQVLGCVNLGDKNIAGFVSQFLLLGVSHPDGGIILVTPENPVNNGQRLH
jgi:tRNA-binding protein